MKQQKLKDKAYNFKHAAKTDLALSFSLEHISYACQYKGRMLAGGYFPLPENAGITDLLDAIEQFLNQNKTFSLNYQSVKVMYQTQKSTLVPSAMFELEKLKDLFVFNHTLAENDELNYNKLSGVEAYNLFSIPSDISHMLVNTFNSFKIYQQATPLITNALTKLSHHDKQPKVSLMIHRDFFDIVVVKQNKLQFHNSFKYTNLNDFLYFSLYIFDQLKLDPETVPLLITGPVETRSELYNAMKRYVKHVSFMEYYDPKRISYIFNDIPQQYLLNLFNLFRCE